MVRAAPRSVTGFAPRGEGSSGGAPAPVAPRLLLVEGSVEMARFLCHTLADGFRVEVVADVPAAMAFLAAQVPDLVLCDLGDSDAHGHELISRIREDEQLKLVPIVLLSERAFGKDAASGLGSAVDDYLVKPFSVLELRARLEATLARSRERRLDIAWRRAVVRAMREALLIFDRDGMVLETNDAFTALFGYTLADGPIVPPYPWWPTEEEDPAGRAALLEAFTRTTRGMDVEGEYRMYRKDRTPLWVSSIGTVVSDAASGRTAYLRSLRDITREKEAQQRRAAAASVSRELMRAEDLELLLGVAERGFSVLFGGTAALHFTGSAEDASDEAHGRLPLACDREQHAEPGPSAGGHQPVPGLLITPGEERTDWDAWVQFDQPRVVGTDEVIVADMLALAFSQALDRVQAAVQFADQQAHLERAIESHRLIGQAVGILVERHRLLPAQAFERLRSASRLRSTGMRDLAVRVIETGAEPEEA
jgi:PAS domain S-box-containing protein